MPVFALYNFDDVGTTAADSALGNGAQNGLYLNGAAGVGGQAVLDGQNDIVKIYHDPSFQMARGTLDIQFSLADQPLTQTQTVLSRDSVGTTNGGYHIDILADGSVVISHETPTGTETFGTAAGFAHPGDEIKLSYSWDQAGTGGQLHISNLTSADTFADAVPNTLTMDMGAINQPWIIGAGQSASDPDILNNINQFFAGRVEMFQLSDTVDNTSPDGIVRGTNGADYIDTTYIDPFDTDRVDHNDAILPGDAPNDDRILAGNGNDTVVAGLGDDSVEGGAGADQVSGGLGNDTLFGGAGNDRLEGNEGDDSLVGGGDNNTLIGGDGADTLIGGGPSVIYGDLPGASDLPDQAYPGIYAADANPTNNTDLIFGGDNGATIYGGDDADTIYGGAGADVIDGGVDDDTIAAGGANDLVTGGEGDDTIDGGAGDDVIYGEGAGNPSPELADDAGDLVTDNNRDMLSGGDGNDAIYGGDDDDTLNGGAAADTLDGGIDDDLVNGDAGDDLLVGGQGNDTLIGGADRDWFTGGNAGDVVDGSETGIDNDTLDLRGLGPLTIAYDPSNPENGVVTFVDAFGNPTGTMTFTNIENVLVDQNAPDGIVRGTEGGDLIDTNYIDPFDTDRVDHNDAILPGDAPNDDRILAGGGNDTVLAGAGDDSVEGGAGNDSERGGLGDDTLLGQAGNDTLIGEGGDDSLIGGDGNDSANGGDGNDLIDTSGGGSAPRPDQGYPGLYASDSDPFNDRDTVNGGTGDDTIRTGDDADQITGGFGNDLIEGGFDDDTIDGNQDNDTIIGGEGNDLIDGGQGDDLIYGGYGPGVPDAVNIRDDQGDLLPNNGRDSITGGLGNDTIFGMDDDDTIDGGQGNDLINAGIDDDLVIGSAGNDTVTGGQGADTLSGGNDRDTFLISEVGDGINDVIDGNEGGDDYDTLDLRGAGPLHIIYDPNNPENGTVQFFDADRNVTGTMTFTNIENVIPCFTPGTLIATPKGEVPVESLKAGDRVITRDNGIQEIRWTGRKDMGWHDLVANPHLKPVMIRQGSLGNGLPERDMMVSPNHRLLVANDRTALYFDEHEVLVSAKHLVASRGIDAIDSVGTSYIHFMFDRHEVVLSNGAWTESFQPGDYTLKGMGNAQRSEIFDLFPELKTEAGLEGYQAARRTLKRHEAMLLVK